MNSRRQGRRKMKTKAEIKVERWARELEKKFSYKWLKRELYKAEREARKSKTHTLDVYVFEANLEANMEQLTADIWQGLYRPTPGIKFVVRIPVPREVYAPPFRDRIVHHFLFRIMYPWWDARFINDSYSCRYGKGTFYGIERLEHHIRSVSLDYTRETWVAKMDIRGFFMSLSHDKLMERVDWGIDRQFVGALRLKKMVRFLWVQILYTDPRVGVKMRGDPSDWDILPPTKILDNQPDGYGIVIGNLTSQLLSNMFMDLLDRYITQTLGYKHYGRYVDDFYIVVPAEQKEQLLRDVEKIRKFLEEEMELTLHPKKFHMQEASHGVEFLGVVIHKNYKTVSRRLKHNFSRAAIEIEWGIRTPDSVVSYLGILSHVDGKKFTKKVFDYVAWDYDY